MDELQATIKKFENELGFEISEKMLEDFQKYAQLLVEWNEKMNLTGITDPKGIAIKHFVDSLMILKYVDIPQNSTLIDVGTGAGFPGLPIKIARNDIDLTLLDSLNKRLTFLGAVSDELGFENALVHSRGEQAGADKLYRGKYDYATARAVSHLRELSEYTLPLVKKGGFLVAMKGSNIETELEEAQFAIKKMGGEVEKVVKFELDDAGSRSLVIIKKISQTPPKYPRPSAKIAKFPLI